MASNRRKSSNSNSNRVTNVNPWIIGGDGQLRDLIPLSPGLIIAGKLFSQAVRAWRFTLPILIALTIYYLTNSITLAILAIIMLPIIYISTRIALLYYKNPDIPLLVRTTTTPRTTKATTKATTKTKGL